MPLVTMPGGEVVMMPDKLTPELAAKLKARMDMDTQSHLARAKEMESPFSAKNLAGAAVEPMMSMASGALATGAGDIAGLGTALGNKLGITAGNPLDAMNKTKDSLTYQPKTEGGQTAMMPWQAAAGIVGGEEQAEAHNPWSRQALNQQALPGKPSPTGQVVGQSVSDAIQGLLGGKLGARAAEIPGVMKPKPPITSAARRLAREGVENMTPGQRRGGVANDLEQKATSLPITGHIIKEARGKAVESWNRSEVNTALKDAGVGPVPERYKGRDALNYAYRQLGKAYDKVVGKQTGTLDNPSGAARRGPSLRQDLDSFKKQALNNPDFDKPDAVRFGKTLDQSVIDKFDKQGKASGDTVKKVLETLRTKAAEYRRGGPSDRALARAYDDTHDAVMRMLKRENPKAAAEMERIDKGYAQYKAAEKASGYARKENQGTYTPAQKERAIQARDKSKDKGQFARGTAPGQKKAMQAGKVLGNHVPDSGTAGRSEIINALHNPLRLGGDLAASIPAALLYNQPVLKALQRRALSPSTGATGTGALLGAGAATEEQRRVLQQAGAVP